MLMVPSTHGLIAAPKYAPIFTTAPHITGNTNGPNAFPTDTLTVNFVVAGAPQPTVTYQWFVIIAPGQYALIGTTQSIAALLASQGTGLPNAGVFCTVAASNTLGTVSAGTPTMFVSAAG